MYSNPYYDGKTRWRLAPASSLFCSLGSDHADCSVFYSYFFPACYRAKAHILPFVQNPLPLLLPWFLITLPSSIHMSFLQASPAQPPYLAQLASLYSFIEEFLFPSCLVCNHIPICVFNIWIPHEIVSFMKARIRFMFFCTFHQHIVGPERTLHELMNEGMLILGVEFFFFTAKGLNKSREDTM